MMEPVKQKCVLAIASSGGHWVELRRLRPAWKDCQLIYVSTSKSREQELIEEAEKEENPLPIFHAVVEASRWEKFKLLRQLFQITVILLKTRPDVIVSTGAACGFFALKIGKYFGARTVWVDSIANAEELSLSGQKVADCADLWLTQWEHLAKSNRKGTLRYEGTVV